MYFLINQNNKVFQVYYNQFNQDDNTIADKILNWQRKCLLCNNMTICTIADKILNWPGKCLLCNKNNVYSLKIDIKT